MHPKGILPVQCTAADPTPMPQQEALQDFLISRCCADKCLTPGSGGGRGQNTHADGTAGPGSVVFASLHCTHAPTLISSYQHAATEHGARKGCQPWEHWGSPSSLAAMEGLMNERWRAGPRRRCPKLLLLRDQEDPAARVARGAGHPMPCSSPPPCSDPSGFTLSGHVQTPHTAFKTSHTWHHLALFPVSSAVPAESCVPPSLSPPGSVRPRATSRRERAQLTRYLLPGALPLPQSLTKPCLSFRAELTHCPCMQLPLNACSPTHLLATNSTVPTGTPLLDCTGHVPSW